MRSIVGFSVGLMVVLWGAPLAVAAATPIAAVSGPLGGPHAATSTNWAGFAVTASPKTVTDAKGSWIVPAISGTCPASRNEYSSFWVGIDGYSSNTVEQTGTDSDCQGGAPTYYAWYEFYPRPLHVIRSLTISAGDTISAEVHFASGKFTTTLKDVTTGTSASATATVSSAHRNSAEWIAEAPSSNSGVLPLADFGTVFFGTDSTRVASTCFTTIGGTTGAFGSFANLHSITMVNNAGTMDKARPSSVSSDHTSFNVTWVSAGP